MKTIMSIVALMAALAGSPAAQTLAEQLQRGIYTEETLGNRDEAMRIYKQILAAPSLPAPIYAEAQRRLARLLLPAQRPPQPPPVVMGTSVLPAMPDRGVVEGNRYRHPGTGIVFDVPPGWKAGPTGPSSDDGDGMTMTNGTHSIHVWMIREETPPDQVAARVAAAPARKIEQRRSGYAIPGMRDASTYHIPDGAIFPMTLNGRHAMVAIAEYVGWEPGSLHDMREYMAWIYTSQSRLFFHSRFRMTLPDLKTVAGAFDQLLHSVSIP